MFWEQKIMFSLKILTLLLLGLLPPGAAAPLTPTNYALKTTPTAI
jgi:hypothetical protein